MSLKKNLIGILMSGAVLANTQTSDAEITASLNRPIEFYDIFGPVDLRLPDNVDYLHEMFQLRTSVHVKDDLGIDLTKTNVWGVVGGQDVSISYLERTSADNKEADYTFNLTINPSSDIEGIKEISIHAKGLSGMSNEISVGTFPINMPIPNAITSSLISLELYSKEGLQLPDTTRYLAEGDTIRANVKMTHIFRADRINTVIGVFTQHGGGTIRWGETYEPMSINPNDIREANYSLSFVVDSKDSMSGTYPLSIWGMDVWGQSKEFQLGDFYFNTEHTPEPSSLALLVTGTGALALRRRDSKTSI